MRIAFIISVFISLILLFSCEEQGWIVKCPDCTSEEPTEAILEAKVDPVNVSNGAAVIKVYRGNLEDSILMGTYVTNDEIFDLTVKLNTKYTLAVTYYYFGKYYTTVDSATPRVKYEKEQCDKPCYLVYDKILNLRLKYH
jgi:hypothetical protein